MRELGMFSFQSYLEYLERTPGEAQNFIDLITTNETYFFRTPRIWEHLEKEFLPTWIKENPNAPFNAWSAAASSGEEAHSLGILLQQFREKHPSFQYQIVATDISREILEKAEKGLYSGHSIDLFQSTQADLFKKYMREADSGHYSVNSEIRSRIKFHQHNLFEKPKFKMSFDLVLARNVLIYFGPTDQEKVLTQIQSLMKKNSLLVIGESESLTRLKTSFIYKMPLIYNRGEAA